MPRLNHHAPTRTRLDRMNEQLLGDTDFDYIRRRIIELHGFADERHPATPGLMGDHRYITDYTARLRTYRP